MGFVEKEEAETLLMAHFLDTDIHDDNVWSIDSGCSNHMTSSHSLFEKLDVSQKSNV